MFQIGKNASRLLVWAYLLASLLLRMFIEPQLQGIWLLSLAFGVFGLLFLYALLRGGVLNPGWFSFEKAR